MNIKMRWLCVTMILILSVEHAGGAEIAGQTKKMTMGIFPRDSGKNTVVSFTPLVTYLKQALGVDIDLVLAKDFTTFLAQLDKGGFDIVHMNQAHYIRVRGSSGYEVVAMNREGGSDWLRAAVFVRKDSPAAAISDLRGKTIIFGGDRMAFISYQAGHKLIREGGLSPQDYQERTSINPPGALIALARGQADAAVCGDVLLNRPTVRQSIDAESIRMLAVSETYPGLPWAVKRTLPKELRDAVARALLNYHETEDGRRSLEAAGIEKLVPARDSDFDRVADLAAEYNER